MITGLVSQASAWTHAHLHTIAMAFTATVLVTYGDVLNRWLRRHTAKLPWVVRTAIFVGVAGFGYGALSLLLAPVLGRLLLLFGPFWLAPMTLGAFVLIGVLAERRKKI